MPPEGLTTAQIASFFIQGGILLMGGVLGLLVRGASQRLGELASAVEHLRREVGDQGRALAGGSERFRSIERRLDDIEDRVEAIQLRGCARAGGCVDE